MSMEVTTGSKSVFLLADPGLVLPRRTGAGTAGSTFGDSRATVLGH
jgi:hypothetical protein